MKFLVAVTFAVVALAGFLVYAIFSIGAETSFHMTKRKTEVTHESFLH